MSERKVLGWAVRRTEVARWRYLWLKEPRGAIPWGDKIDRHKFASEDEAIGVANWHHAHGDKGARVVPIYAKPKAPKPDKLEQAIAEVRTRVANFDGGKRDALRGGICFNALRCEHWHDAASSILEFLEALR